MMNYAWDFSQWKKEKYFEWIILTSCTYLRVVTSLLWYSCKKNRLRCRCYQRALDAKTRTTTSTRFSQYSPVLTREPASFWRENEIAVVTLLRVLARMLKWRKQVINVRSLIILRSGEGLTSFNKDNSANVSWKKKYDAAFRKVYFFKSTRKNVKKKKSNLVRVVVLVLVAKAHYYFSPVLTQEIRNSLPIQSHNERKTFRNQKLSKDNWGLLARGRWEL